jgi:hypothetical protein
MKKQMAKGKAAAQSNPWEVDYNAEMDTKSLTGKQPETLLDKAKSFSF